MKYDELQSVVGKRLRISRGPEVFEGVLKGLAPSFVSVSPTETVHPWLLDAGNGRNVEFMPEMWHVQEIHYFVDK